MRLAAILALCAAPVYAQNFPSEFRNGSDTVEIEAHGTAEALVTYRNHPSHASGNGVSTVAVGEIIVDLEVIVNTEGTSDELAIARPRHGYIAIPDRAAVADGDSAEFRIMLPMY